MLRDASLPHQIVLVLVDGGIGVSCSCMRRPAGSPKGQSRPCLEVRHRWDDPAEPRRIWQAHVDERTGR